MKITIDNKRNIYTLNIISSGLVYPLMKTSSSNLLNLRMEPTPYVFVKYYDEYFYAEVEKDFSAYSMKKFTLNKDEYIHLCGSGCKCLKATPTTSFEDSGCDKVVDRSYEFIKTSSIDKIQTLIFSSRMEKYPFIKVAIETINVEKTSFVVLKCENFRKIHNPKRPKYESESETIKKAKMVEGIREFLYT